MITPVTALDEEALDESARLAAEPEVKPVGFVVSISKEGLHRKLHFIGACFRIPGVHYRNYRILGELMPSEYDIDSKCLDCFPGEKPAQAVVHEPFVASEEETFSTSSSSSVAPAAKRRAKRHCK